MKLIFNKFPQYTFFHEMLRQNVVAVNPELSEVRKPEERLLELMEAKPKDRLVAATQRVVSTIMEQTTFSVENLGVFGSMLHGFHHPDFSDIDIIVYGREENVRMREVLKALYADGSSDFSNEFSNISVMEGKRWLYQNLTVKEFLWHQHRKQIYGLFNDTKSGRVTKTEFEPVKAWSEITSEYNSSARIIQKGWVKLKARIVDDTDAGFIPSVYIIQPLEVVSGPREAVEAVRVFSYMEEFRLQAQKDEIILIEGNLEEVASPNGSFHQVALTYCPRYYEQVLKVDGLY
jgi:predicted nucleotidyltransferase